MFTLEEKKRLVIFFTFFLLAALIVVGYLEARKKRLFYEALKPVISSTSRECVECHRKKMYSPVSFNTWQKSKHALSAVGCADCHIPVEGVSDQILRGESKCEKKNVRRSVSFQNCILCHKEEGDNFEKGLHGGDHRRAYKTISLLSLKEQDKQFCLTCHSISKNKGECGKCHIPHSFDAQFARNYLSCSPCHSGDFHPQTNSYTSSVHFALFGNDISENTEGELEKVFKSPDSEHSPSAPSCAFCHHNRLSPFGAFFAGLRSKNAESFRNIIGSSYSGEFLKLIEKSWPDSKNYEIRIKTLEKRCSCCHSRAFTEEKLEEMETKLDRAIAALLKQLNRRVLFPDLLYLENEKNINSLLILKFVKGAYGIVHFGKTGQLEGLK